jgi:putative Mg2+ transporter-C (MgtC) family protein
MPLHDYLFSFWSPAVVQSNILIIVNVVGAMLLGFVVGYERSYHGRAAGMRTYGLVCMASCALVVISGYPDLWYGSRLHSIALTDPTRTIQGIVAGIGFLGAGVIMKDNYSISGLTTAASLWASCAIGIMVGLGLYAASIGLAVLSATCMLWVSKLETRLPSRQALAVTIQFKSGVFPLEEALRKMAKERGYDLASGTISITYKATQIEWRFVLVAVSKKLGIKLSALSLALTELDGVESFHLSHARN